ncbi:hypothetical protein [Actinomadura madurae]|nr:hypothetical protein [Actinomadura madurae]
MSVVLARRFMPQTAEVLRALDQPPPAMQYVWVALSASRVSGNGVACPWT